MHRACDIVSPNAQKFVVFSVYVHEPQCTARSLVQDPRHKRFWIPQRCEVDGCTNREQAKRCSQCRMVMYCSECDSVSVVCDELYRSVQLLCDTTAPARSSSDLCMFCSSCINLAS